MTPSQSTSRPQVYKVGLFTLSLPPWPVSRVSLKLELWMWTKRKFCWGRRAASCHFHLHIIAVVRHNIAADDRVWQRPMFSPRVEETQWPWFGAANCWVLLTANKFSRWLGAFIWPTRRLNHLWVVRNVLHFKGIDRYHCIVYVTMCVLIKRHIGCFMILEWTK